MQAVRRGRKPQKTEESEAKQIEKPTIIYRKPEICPRCDTVESLVTTKTRSHSSFIQRIRRCRRCGHKIEERTAVN